MDQTQTPSEHPKLDALIAGYIEAVERGVAPDRGQIMAENPDLATELKAFFDDLDRVQRAAASPNDGPTPNKPDAAYPSTVIRSNNEPTPGVLIAGRYKLLENIGEGGMGSVWVAEQLKPVKRKVAIKLIKPGMDSKQVLARFEAERQALAVMDHPNIAKVFDGGLTEQGRPYFVMEYVKGVPFTDYCDRARLPLKDRLTLFIAVCSAVQHAHQKGIVHRDLKPSNILICLYDGHPVPKVIDFGLAKAMHQPLTEQSIFTGHGVMVGTPLYMSPEQAESNNLDIDTRTDIYSLGVVLYELLTGSTPLERQQLQKAAFDEVLRLIKEVEPPRPSLRLSGSESLASIAAQRSIDPKQLSRSLAGDLDWIVMKTLDKERSRRYETANGLARDIERFLNEEPVEACPPSTAYRVRKFIKRYKPQVIAAAILLLSLVAGIIGTTWGLQKARIAEDKAVASEKKTRSALEEAEAARIRSEEAELLLFENYRESADQVTELLIGSKDEYGPKEKEYLERTLERWQLLADRQGDDIQSRNLRAEGSQRVADLWRRFGQDDKAKAAFISARDLRKDLVRDFPENTDYMENLAATHNNLGVLLFSLREREAARVEFESAKSLRKSVAQRFPSSYSCQMELAMSHNNLSRLLTDLGEYTSAQLEVESSIAIMKSLVQKDPTNNPQYQCDLAVSHNSLGVILSSLGKHESALEEFDTAKNRLAILSQHHPNTPEYRFFLALSHNGRGEAFITLNDKASARIEHESARGVLKELVEQFPTVPSYQSELAETQFKLSQLLVILGEKASARAEYDSSIRLLDNLTQKFPDNQEYKITLGSIYCTHGNSLLSAGQAQESIESYTRAIEVFSSFSAREEHDAVMSQGLLLSTYVNRARALVSLSKHAESVADWDQAISLIPRPEQWPIRLARVEAELRSEQVVSGSAELDEIALQTKAGGADSHDWKPEELYQIAYLYSFASQKMGDRESEYQDKSIVYLRMAIKAGVNSPLHALHFASDTDLNPLRGRGDFRELMQSLVPQPEKMATPTPVAK